MGIMLELRVYDFVTGQQVQTIKVVNAEFFVGLVVGVLIALIFWNTAKGMTGN